MTKMRAVRYLIEQSSVEGVKYFFGMQGGRIAPLFNELYDYRFVCEARLHYPKTSGTSLKYASAAVE